MSEQIASSITKTDLLIELGSEELPPKALKSLMIAFGESIRQGLEQKQLGFQQLKTFATPRRLAVQVLGLDSQQQDREQERRGPALAAAFDAEGQPTKAAQGFARSCGVTPEQLTTLETEQGSWLIFRSLVKGQQSAELIPDMIETAIQQLPIPKRMTWGAEKFQFVRPVHWLLVLLGDAVVPCRILGLNADRFSYGHRFHAPEAIAINKVTEYENLLENHRVVVNFNKRQQQILEQVTTLAKQKTQGQAAIEADLLDEVTGLVEWPVPLLGNFDTEFLKVPQEALISAMQGHQKYFPVLDRQQKILPHFITLANIESHDPDKVIAGNERVIRPRLADARFFYETDQKKTLQQHNEPLKKVVFEASLGSLYEKAERVAELAKFIAETIGIDPEIAHRAGLLSKADLATEMVAEFPELQGIMGTYYARLQQEPESLALALNEQYQPRFSGDQLPASDTGAAVAIADKLDTLVGILGIGKHPTGDKDPYGLRRAALGLLRIIVGKTYPLDLKTLIAKAREAYQDRLNNQQVEQDCLQFLQGRYLAWYQDEGISTDIIKAVLQVNPSQPLDFHRRVQAVEQFSKLPEATALAAANKRVGNLLSKQNFATDNSNIDVDKALLCESAEQALFAAVVKLQMTNTDKASDNSFSYSDRLHELATLKESVDQFFDEVMVNVENTAIKNNRLALLHQLRCLFLDIADISLLQQ